MKRFITIWLVSVAILSVASLVEAYSGGTGDPNTPYLIGSADDIIEMSNEPNDWDDHFLMITDVNMVDYTFTTAVIDTFEGVFDGNEHKVLNLTIDTVGASNNYLGLFGQISDEQAQVRNLGLENVSITGGDDSSYIGGLCGVNYGMISACYTTGSVSGGVDSKHLGGLCGKNSGSITNCYATGNVLGNARLGGLCGWNAGTISNCYATGSVLGDDYTGGLVGIGGQFYITSSYWDIESSGQGSSAGGIGKTTAEMKLEITFLGWWCDSAWTILEGVDYPRLIWEDMPGEIITVPLDLYGGGTGEPNDPYLIYTAEQLNSIGLITCDTDKHFKLIADVNLVDYSYTTAVIRTFSGVFDGADNKIFNLTAGEGYLIGLFGQIKSDGEVMNLGLENISIGGRSLYRVGGLCGENFGTITNCYATGSISGEDDMDYFVSVGFLCGVNRGTVANSYAIGSVSINEADYSEGYEIGSLCGQNDGGTITNCYAISSISISGMGQGCGSIGGLCGDNSQGTIIDCYSKGFVTVTGGTFVEHAASGIGGLCGSNAGTIRDCYSESSVTDTTGLTEVGDYSYALGGLCGRNGGEIVDCYATGSVSGGDHSGGLGGLCGSNYRGTINNCYANGSVSGGDYSVRLGGLSGYNYWGTITNCYANGSVIGGVGSSDLGGLCGKNWESTITNCLWDIETGGPDNGLGTPLPTSQMQTLSTFTDAGWDFVRGHLAVVC
jgi:hypothetical protein